MTMHRRNILSQLSGISDSSQHTLSNILHISDHHIFPQCPHQIPFQSLQISGRSPGQARTMPIGIPIELWMDLYSTGMKDMQRLDREM